MSELTDRQRQIYDYIKGRIEGGAGAPSLREIGEEFYISSPNGVASHLHALKQKGYVEWEPGKKRTLRLTRKGIPVLGVIEGGKVFWSTDEWTSVK